MTRLSIFLLFTISAMGFGSQALAISISLQPRSQLINLGETTSVDVMVSGFGDMTSPSLGAFDFDLSYDPFIIMPVSVRLGPHLGFGFFGSDTFGTPGMIHLDGVSLESSSDLNANQPGMFSLATYDFIGTGIGLSRIDFTFVSLSDEGGNSLADVSELGGSIRVPDGGSTCFLLGIALLCVLSVRRRVYL